MIVEATIDGIRVQVRRGTWLIEAAAREGIQIPSLCYHEALGPLGSCRLCLVEIESGGRTRIATSCNYPTSGGESVRTSTEKIRKLRRAVLELLLPLAPGSAALRRLARDHGIRKSRFEGRVERTDCILCGLCARACHDLAGVEAIDFSRRGSKRSLCAPFEEETDACIACGACDEICPTGRVSMEEAAARRFRSSPASSRWCRYHLMGISPGALCPMNYDCPRCEIDQMVRSFYGGHPLVASAAAMKRKMMEEGG